jgi:hypothetical protein
VDTEKEEKSADSKESLEKQLIDPLAPLKTIRFYYGDWSSDNITTYRAAAFADYDEAEANLHEISLITENVQYLRIEL